MAVCPFATFKEISGSSGAHVGGPFKIVHHTTEGSSAAGAMAAFRSNRSDPHFTIDANNIFQHIDTAFGARALRNRPGGVQTNRDGALQIELVGFAHLAKNPRALANVARVCRWLESEHGIPNTWPSGPPKPAVNGKDPGGHNRNASTWDSQGGHYGHCHVPENDHWDPGYTAAEVAFLRDAKFDRSGTLVGPPLPPTPQHAIKRRATGARGRSTSARKATTSTMPPHEAVSNGVRAYIQSLPMPDVDAPVRKAAVRKATKKARRAPTTSQDAKGAAIDVGAVLSFVDGIDLQAKQDVLCSVQLAQRAASGAFDRFSQTQAWYGKYIEVLENLGWTTEAFAFSHFEQAEGEFRMDQAALKIITAIATQNQLLILRESISAREKAANGDAITLFDYHASTEGSGNFQIGAVQASANGALAMALGAFYFRAVDQRKRFLFFKWGAQDIHFWTAAQRMTFNRQLYASLRTDVEVKLGQEAGRYLAGLRLGGR